MLKAISNIKRKIEYFDQALSIYDPVLVEVGELIDAPDDDEVAILREADRRGIRPPEEFEEASASDEIDYFFQEMPAERFDDIQCFVYAQDLQHDALSILKRLQKHYVFGTAWALWAVIKKIDFVSVKGFGNDSGLILPGFETLSDDLQKLLEAHNPEKLA